MSHPLISSGAAVAAGTLTRAVSSPWFLAATLTLAAVLRVGHVLALRPLPLFDGLILDSAAYDEWARRIAAGDWMGGTRAFYQDPLYPYFLAGLYAAFGRDLLVVRLIQAALGVATCGLVAGMGRAVATRAVGNVAALMVAVYRPAIFEEVEVEKTALGVFLVTVALTLAMRPSIGARLAAGAALGLATLARGNLLVVAPLAALFYLVERDPPGSHAGPGSDGMGGHRPRVGSRLHARGMRSAAVFLLGFSLVLAPVAWRNHRVSGEWILTTSQAGQVFYTGNNPANTTGGFVSVPFVRSDPIYEEMDFHAMAEARLGRRVGPTEASAYWLRQAWRHILANPSFAATMMWRKFALFWSDVEVADAWEMYHLARYSPVLALPLPGFGWLLPLAVIGALTGFRRSREVRWLAGFVTVYSLSVIAFFVFSRYRLHIVPALAVLAASALPWLGNAVRSRDVSRVLGAALVAGAVAGLAFFGAADARFRARNQVQSYINLAGLYQRRGDTAAAERTLGEALQKVPDSVPATCELGRLHFWKGDLPLAHRHLSRCVASNPWHPEAWLTLGQVYEASGMLAPAIQAYHRQLEILPGDVKTQHILAVAEIRAGRAGNAADRLSAIVATREEPRLELTLVVALLAMGRSSEAQAFMDRAATRGRPISREQLDQEHVRLYGRRRPS